MPHRVHFENNKYAYPNKGDVRAAERAAQSPQMRERPSSPSLGTQNARRRLHTVQVASTMHFAHSVSVTQGNSNTSPQPRHASVVFGNND